VGLEVRKTVRKLRLARKLSPSHAIGSTRAYGQNTYDQHTTTKFVIQQLINDTSCCWVYEFYSFYGELEKQDWILIIHMNWFVVCGDF
jgi:hypothetical protein